LTEETPSQYLHSLVSSTEFTIRESEKALQKLTADAINEHERNMSLMLDFELYRLPQLEDLRIYINRLQNRVSENVREASRLIRLGAVVQIYGYTETLSIEERKKNRVRPTSMWVPRDTEFKAYGWIRDCAAHTSGDLTSCKQRRQIRKLHDDIENSEDIETYFEIVNNKITIVPIKGLTRFVHLSLLLLNHNEVLSLTDEVKERIKLV
jgi:hypothetical protein